MANLYENLTLIGSGAADNAYCKRATGRSGMAFKNEYIPKADYEKYDLLKVFRAHNQTVHRDRFIHPDSWTIDREREVFLIEIWVHREAEFLGYGFYWKGEWMFFDMRPVDRKYDAARNEIWFRFLVNGFVVPERLTAHRDELMRDLHEAITVKDAPTGTIKSLPATIDFITEL